MAPYPFKTLERSAYWIPIGGDILPNGFVVHFVEQAGATTVIVLTDENYAGSAAIGQIVGKGADGLTDFVSLRGISSLPFDPVGFRVAIQRFDFRWVEQVSSLTHPHTRSHSFRQFPPSSNRLAITCA